MVNKEHQIKNSFIYFIPWAISAMVPLITLPIFTRVLTKEDYGALALAEIYSICANGLAWASLEAAYERNFFEYLDNPKKSAQLIYSILLFALTNFGIFSILTFFIKGDMANIIFHNVKYADILFYSFCGMFFVRFNEFCLIYFKNSQDASRYSRYQIIFTLLNMCTALFFIVFLKMGPIGIVAAQFISAFCVSLLLVYKLLSILPVALDFSVFKEALKVGLPLLPNTFMKIAGTKIDAIMISVLASLGGVGLYNIAQKIANMSFSVMTAMDHVFKPETYRLMFEKKDCAGEIIGCYLTPFIYISTGFGMLVAMFAYEILFLLTPPSYHAAANIVTVLSVYCAILFFGKINPLQLIYAKKPHLLTLLAIVTYGLNFFLNIPFVYKWGAIGSAWAIFLSNIISGSIFFYVAQKYYNIRWEYSKICKIFTVLFISSFITLLLSQARVCYGFILFVKAVFIFIYIYLGVKINIITMENIGIVKKVFMLKFL